jgi:RNA ligase
VDKREAVQRLSEFVRLLSRDWATNRRLANRWQRNPLNWPKMEKLFDYHQKDGMPSISSLVSVSHHPDLDLVLLNYTPAAHNTLHAFPQGWTEPLRLCRGIVFDRNGELVALPFRKFFNYGEHPETMVLSDEPFEATVKYDGHLGIIFRYQDQIILTTRGEFTSKSSLIGNAMLKDYLNGWQTIFPGNLTLAVEIIHPETRVFTDYSFTGFMTIGATDINSLDELSYREIVKFAEYLGLPFAEAWEGNDIAQLIQYMQNPTVLNQEGYVVRFTQSGIRMKLKFQTYIGKMVAAKLSYTYLMNRIMSGNLERMLDTLPEEILDQAKRMLGEIMLAISISGPFDDVKIQKARWQRLYNLASEEKRTSYFEEVCRRFVRYFS